VKLVRGESGLLKVVASKLDNKKDSVLGKHFNERHRERVESECGRPGRRVGNLN
jgi:hypothetical protein